jgi:predicted phosphoribosyltransferase
MLSIDQDYIEKEKAYQIEEEITCTENHFLNSILKTVILALPVTSKEPAALLQQECDRLEVVMKPSSGFRSVGQYYQNFEQVTDDQVIQIMNNRNIDALNPKKMR